jgi:hypothetical protein
MHPCVPKSCCLSTSSTYVVYRSASCLFAQPPRPATPPPSDDQPRTFTRESSTASNSALLHYANSSGQRTPLHHGFATHDDLWRFVLFASPRSLLCSALLTCGSERVIHPEILAPLQCSATPRRHWYLWHQPSRGLKNFSAAQARVGLFERGIVGLFYG